MVIVLDNTDKQSRNERICKSWGFSERYLSEATMYEGLFLGRVVSQSKDLYKVVTAGNGEIFAEVAGKLRFSAKDPTDFPATGDFVMLDRADDVSGNAIIHRILTRKSAFIRKAAGTANDSQIVAANIDTVFICMSLNQDFNLRRLERYLSIAWDSGAVPVVVLTKSDLCTDIPEKLASIERSALGADILITSGLTEDGYESVKKYIVEGKTVAFLGSSGVGKSTLINRLLGEERIETAAIRKDDRGRHTTTRRELLIIPNGGSVIDTPGMRELGLESVNLEKTFAEISELEKECRFSDCRHESEPGCAVRQAVSDGLLSEERLESYKKLKKEAKYEGLNSREIEQEKMNEMFSEFGGIKNAKAFVKAKHKGR